MKKIGILAMLLIFALGSLGVGYAHWSETLEISGVVETGDIDPVFVGADSNDGCGFTSNDPKGCGKWDYAQSPPAWSGKTRNKDVGCTSGSLGTVPQVQFIQNAMEIGSYCALTNSEIAERLFIGESTVRTYLHRILDKLHLRNRAEATAYAAQHQTSNRF